VALRGDLPATALSPAAPGEFHYASELVRFIRSEHGDTFRIEVAAYPEMHPQAASPTEDFEHFRRKVEAGADAALTQLFYNPHAYFDFLERCAKAGITIPITPGIMPITSYANTMRFCNGCGADLPRWIRLRLEELEHDKTALADFGIGVVTRLCTSTPSTRPAPRSGCGRIWDWSSGSAGQRVSESARFRPMQLAWDDCAAKRGNSLQRRWEF
jgi:methylenetetrahydrofolate reductase (NADPH)